MSHVDQFLRWNPTPLGARCALALARVLAPLDIERSTVLQEHATELAFTVGMTAGSAQIPALLADEGCLAQCFVQGVEQAAWWASQPTDWPRVWESDWLMSDDGIHETRASVCESSEGFIPTLEISRLGGDCEPSYDGPAPTLSQAIGLAKARLAAWASS